MIAADSSFPAVRTNMTWNDAVLVMPWLFWWEYFIVIISSQSFLHVDTGIFVAVRPFILAEPTPEQS